MERAQVGDALLLQAFGIVLPAGLIDDLAGIRVAVKAPGDGGYGKLTVDDGQCAGGVCGQIHRTLCDHFNALGGIAAGQLIVGEDVHGDVTAGLLFHHVGEVTGHAAVDLRVRSVYGHDQVDLLIFGASGVCSAGGAASAQKRQCQDQCDDRDDFSHFHSLLLSFSFRLS